MRTVCGGLFSFLKYDLGWVSSFLQQEVGNHRFKTSGA